MLLKTGPSIAFYISQHNNDAIQVMNPCRDSNRGASVLEAEMMTTTYNAKELPLV
jgi:hypothetical protein